jgi:LmbE family N-acetylglucosaminyl deacetylase
MNHSAHRVLAVGAHPDDVEFMCAGLLALLRNAGCELHIATMSSGDCGSMREKPETLRSIRQAEAEAACRALGAIYHPLEFSDFCIFNDDHANRRVTALLREIDPSIVITHSPQDYLSDHETTSTLVRNACFYGPAPNYKTSQWTATARTSSVPHLYYAHPMEGTDIFGEAVMPHLYVDVTSVFPLKTDMLSCHKSQREWLRAQHGMDEYVESMRRWSRTLGQQASAISGRIVEFAEAYRQHRGHAYPRDPILSTLLGNFVISAPADAQAKNLTSEPTA